MSVAYNFARFVGRLFTSETEKQPPDTEAKSFGILVLGDEGAGKSNLINRLLEEDVAAVAHSPQPLSAQKVYVACHSGRIHGVPVNMYEFPSPSSAADGVLKRELQSRKLHAFICCVKVSETRLRGSVIDTLEGYHTAGVDWSKTTMVLTFADCMLVPKEVRRETAGIRGHFEKTLAQWQKELREVLVKRFRVRENVAKKIEFFPATSESDKLLLNGQQWLVPLQFAIIILLPPEATKMYQDSLRDCGKALRQKSSSSSSSVTFEESATSTSCTNSHASATSLSTSSSEWFEDTHTSAVHSAARSGTSVSTELEVSTTLTAPLDEQTQFWQSVRDTLSRLKMDCPIFGILVIGETGSGKSTLINNLLGQAVATIGHTMKPGTINVNPHELSVGGVPVVVYDTPGLDDSSGIERDQTHLEIIKNLLTRGKIHLVIFCWKMTENRMRGGLIRTFKEYSKIGVPWQQTVVALTFADMVTKVFDSRLPEMCHHLTNVLVEEADLSESMVKTVKLCPTTACYEELLPNGRPWYVPFWLNVQEILIPAATARFLDMHKYNISDDKVLASSKPSHMQFNLIGQDRVHLAETFAASLPISESDQVKVKETILVTGLDAIRKMLSEDMTAMGT